MTKYVTEELLLLAKGNDRGERLDSFDVSSTSYLKFGTYGLDLIRLSGRKMQYKYVSDWVNKSANEINQELNGQDWVTV